MKFETLNNEISSEILLYKNLIIYRSKNEKIILNI